MRKIYLAWALLLSAIGVQAQEYNLFPASVVDENGWLWFNSQNIVDQYVGVCNEEDYKVDPEGKIIQMVYADQFQYPSTTVDPDAIGYGKAASWVQMVTRKELSSYLQQVHQIHQMVVELFFACLHALHSA